MKDKKIILQVNTVLSSGSISSIANAIGNNFIRYGWESYIACSRKVTKKSNSKIIKIGSRFGFYLNTLLARIFDNDGRNAVISTYFFLRKLKKIKPDLIILHNLHGYYLNYNILFTYLKKNKIRTFWLLHDCWPVTGHCTYFDYSNCNRWQSICYSCPIKNEYPKSFFLDNSTGNYLLKKSVFSNFDQLIIITPSLWLSNIISKSFLKNTRCEVIHNGIDLNIFKENSVLPDFFSNHDCGTKFKILGVANQWIKRKGYFDFVALSESLLPDELIIMVGLDKGQLSNLPKNIIGIERTKSVQELVKIYSHCDVLFNPTYEDNLPTVILESMACGTPVVTYNTGGAPEPILNDETGYVVRKGDISSAVSLMRIIKTRKKSFYSNNCVKRIKEYFNCDFQNERYVKLAKIYYE